ncbi:flippase [Candidatus Micrarchaeota archaeon]|nr:flippase [Candidatus Micrarchaeota archaeon]
MILEEQKTMVKGTIWGLIGNIALKLITLVYLTITTRLFSQDAIGTFYLGLSIISVLSIFGDLGIVLAFTRFIPYYIGRGEKRKAFALLKGAYWFIMVFSLLLAVCIAIASVEIAARYGNPELATVLNILAFFILVNGLFSINSYALISLKRIKDQMLIVNGQNLLKVIITVGYMLLVGSNAAVLSFGHLFSFLIMLIISFWFLRPVLAELKREGEITFKEQVDALKEALPFGFVLTIIASMWVILSSSDRILLGYMLQASEAASAIAVYSMATSLASMLLVIFGGAINTVFLPSISELYSKGKQKEMNHTTAFATRWAIMLMVPPTILFVVFPAEAMGIVYGAAYSSGAFVLMLFSLGFFIRGISLTHGSILAAIRVLKIELIISILAAIVNIVLNILLIPKYGMEGAALASMASFAIITIMLLYYSKKIIGGTFLSGSLKPLIAGIVICVVFLLLKAHVAAVFSISLPKITSGIGEVIYEKIFQLAILGGFFTLMVASYVLLLVLLKAFEKDDRTLLLGGLRKLRIPDPYIVMIENAVGFRE